MKTLAGWFSLLIKREGQDEYYVRETTSISTLSGERVGSGGDDIDLTILTSLSKGTLGSTEVKNGLTAFTSLFNGRVGSNKDGLGLTT